MMRGHGSQNGRLFYAGAMVVVGLLGLGSLALRPRFPVAMDRAGDLLWAILLFMLISFLGPGVKLRWRGAVALAIAFAVEFSQLYHAPWIDRLRGYFVGRLFLGAGFDPIDFVSYTVGVVIGVLTAATAAGRIGAGRRRG